MNKQGDREGSHAVPTADPLPAGQIASPEKPVSRIPCDLVPSSHLLPLPPHTPQTFSSSDTLQFLWPSSLVQGCSFFPFQPSYTFSPRKPSWHSPTLLGSSFTPTATGSSHNVTMTRKTLCVPPCTDALPAWVIVISLASSSGIGTEPVFKKY